MNGGRHGAARLSRLTRGCYLALVAWQPAWHLLLPPPIGARSGWLALAAGIPLLLPLAGIIRMRRRALIWGAYLVLLYFIVGITEAWSSPGHRPAALLQVLLSGGYLAGLIMIFRRDSG